MGMEDIDMHLLWELYRGGGPNIPDVMTGLAVSLQNPTAVPEPRSSKEGHEGLIHKNTAGKDSGSHELPRSELTTRLQQSSLQGEDPREGTKQTILSHQGGSRGSRGWRGWRENRGGGISDSGIFPMPMPGGRRPWPARTSSIHSLGSFRLVGMPVLERGEENVCLGFRILSKVLRGKGHRTVTIGPACLQKIHVQPKAGRCPLLLLTLP